MEIVDAEERTLRERAQAEAEDHGEDPEGILREWARERADNAPPALSRWRCPAEDPGYYLPQREISGARLPDATAYAVAAERIDHQGATERFLYLVLHDESGAVSYERIATTSDPSHGQSWEQLRVVRLAAEGDVVSMDSERLQCVPAGFDEETEEEPAACWIDVRIRARCTRNAAAWSCEHAEELVEEQTWAE